ncbi:hypothetical protein H5410_005987 [Solanum commersonii]|uniref:Uncharacterized protein n=1 Tax=Solanum commersonii TaxID=4109 RepID=A0A9J6A8D9_SOLCO|nr:hypothetical protein H5410_005987 [Solanum commersonii]
MSNSVSTSQTLISQEVENPSSFNFSIPLPDKTPSTPVCGVGETSAIAASRVQTKRARKRRRESIEPKKPTSTPYPIRSSDTESEDVVAYVTKKRKESEKEKVKSKRSQKSSKKSQWKGRKLEHKWLKKIKPVKGPGPRVKKQSEEKEMTKEEQITAMENQKVLNGRVFDPDILTKFGMSNLLYVFSIQGWNHLFEPPVPYLHKSEVREFFYKMELLESGGIATNVSNVETCLEEEILGIILGVPVEGIRTIEGALPST